MRVLITGATGLVGKEIVRLCHENAIDVNYLTTSKHKIEKKDNYQGFYWNPKNNKIDSNCFDGVDVIINLAGASVSKRWTSEYKSEIIKSRAQSTELLAKALQVKNHTIKQIVSASAIGIYPNSLTNYYEEDSKEVDDSFLGKVVTLWESSINSFEPLGLKVCIIRIGLVLSKNEGALPQIVKPVKFGLGAAFGTGKQWQSWIHIEDLARLFMYTITNKLEGVYNGVAPNPVTNTDFTKTIAGVLRRPLISPNIPKFAMKLILGDMHTLLFSSQRVSSKKTENMGFTFNYHHLQPALQDLLK